MNRTKGTDRGYKLHMGIKRCISVLVLLLFGVVLSQPTLGQQTPFDKLASDLSQASCIRVEFLHIVESAVFHDVDSVPGSAVFDNQGRYRILLPNDEFLCDGSLTYAYTIPNNQVVIEEVGSDRATGTHDLLFLAHLKEYYDVQAVSDHTVYRLVSSSAKQRSLPDTMIAHLAGEPPGLERFEYLDVNEDLNQLLIRSLTTDASCADSVFGPAWPDSVDRVKL